MFEEISSLLILFFTFYFHFSGERQKVLNWLISYNPLWLRIGLEVFIFACESIILICLLAENIKFLSC